MDSFAASWITTASKVRSSLLTRQTIVRLGSRIRLLRDCLARLHQLLATRTINLAALVEMVHGKWTRAKLCRVLIGSSRWEAPTAGSPVIFTIWKAANIS